MTDKKTDYIIQHTKCADDELVVQAIRELKKLFKDDAWEYWDRVNYTHDDSVQAKCADSYCLGWETGQAHLLQFFTTPRK